MLAFSVVRSPSRVVSVLAFMTLVSLVTGCEQAPAASSTSQSAGASAASPSTSSGPEFLTPYGTPVNPFSPAVRAGNILYLAGEIGTDSTGNLVKGGIEAETKQVMQNIQRTLAAVGSSMDRVVKCTVFMADMKEWPRMNVIYATFFPTNKPARSALGANGLARDARVEIECIAMTGR
jgi:2-iminobutanoate/2-iminopropanoate deaminase